MLAYAAIGLVVGLLLGLGLGWWRSAVQSRALHKQMDQSKRDLEQRMEQTRQDGENRLQAAQEASNQAREQLITERDRLLQERAVQQSEFRALAEVKDQLGRDLERIQTEQRSLELRMAEKQREFVETQDRLRQDFEHLANRIFEEKNKSFQEQSRKEIGEAINPLRERIFEFQGHIQRVQEKQTEQGAQLKEQILQLTSLNKDMLQDARNLTNALKGDSKTQGNWGEMILESVLEKSGLEKGREYEVQASGTTEEGRRLQPDVVLNLPGGKFIILDSKVSLTAYERFTTTDNSEEQEKYARAHVESLRNHIKQLSAKDYPSLYGVKTQDFVLLFIPIEPAFTLALRYDDNLYMDAFGKNVVLVTPSTLLATLRTIKHIWKQENQSRNVRLIATEAGRLHDKFVGLIDDLRKLGQHLDRSQAAYQDTFKKLSEGSGNLVSKVDKLRKLGAKATKEIPADLREHAMLDDEMEMEETDDENANEDNTMALWEENDG